MLTNEQCDTVIEWLERHEFTGFTLEDIRLFDALISAAREAKRGASKGRRIMRDDKELAAIIARKIFEVGYHAGDATRIQFMIGRDPERPGCGFGEQPLADFIERILNEYRSY